LQPGNYAIKVKALNHTHNPLNMNHGFYVNYSWEEESVSVDESLYAGGKRIKRIENYDENNVLSTKKEYQYLNNLNESSGRIFGLPNFYGVNRILSAVTGLTILQPIGAVGGSPLSTYEGNSVGYTQVTEFNGGENDSKGKIVYEFTTEAAHAFQYDPNSNIADPGYYYDFPYHMPTDKEWLRGKNLKTTYFKSSNNVYTKVREIENKYLYADEDAGGVSSSISFSPVSTIKLLSENLTTSNLLRINTDRKFRLPLITFKPSIDPNTGIIDPYGPTYYKTFYITGGTLDLESSTVTDYYDNGNAVVSTSNYFYNYDKHYQIKRTKTVDSFGETILSNMVYPQDKTSLTTAEGLLKAAHIFTPLQTYSYQDDDKNGIGSTSELLSSQYTLYKDWGNNNILPEKVQTAKGEASFEDRIVFHRYYANGKVKEVSKKDGTPIVYIWGYKQTLPIAKIENATYADVSSYVATLQTLSDADVDRTIGNTGTEGDLRAMLETMRVALSNAQVTYFTYDPLIGTTSITGPRGRTIYYQYDSFNRLEFVKDHDGNILSKNEYNYKN
ncbi:MAG: hypothetical protein JKX82_03105, partial [Oleispira sp.]|nr:hypothetical protein [Oleispira sp.]